MASKSFSASIDFHRTGFVALGLTNDVCVPGTTVVSFEPLLNVLNVV